MLWVIIEIWEMKQCYILEGYSHSCVPWQSQSKVENKLCCYISNRHSGGILLLPIPRNPREVSMMEGVTPRHLCTVRGSVCSWLGQAHPPCQHWALPGGPLVQKLVQCSWQGRVACRNLSVFSCITHSWVLMPEIHLVEANAFHYPSRDKRLR